MSRLAGAEARLRALGRASRIFCFEQDRHLRYVSVNDPDDEQRGRDWIGRTDHDVFEQADAERLAELKRDVLADGRAAATTAFIEWDGRRQRCTISVEPIIEPDGDTSGVAGTLEFAAGAPADSFEVLLDRLRGAVGRSSAFVYVKDLGGRYLLASRSAQDLLSPDLAEVSARRDQIALDRREATQEEETFSGHSFLTLRVPILDEEGDPRALVAIGIDITDYRVMTDRLMEVQRLEVLGQLAAEITHEFHSVLSVISTFSDLVLEAAADDAVRHDVEMIQAAADRGADLTRQLLVFGGARRLSLDAPVVVADAVLDAERLLTRTLGPNITIVTEIGAKATAVAVGAAELDQVLMNLALNARDAMPEGGRIVMRTRRTNAPERGVSPPLDPTASYVCLEVADTGAGMPPSAAVRAFEPYFTTKPRGAGTGLGLATVHEIARRAGGGVALETAPAAGTTVSVYLPVSQTRDSRRFARPVAGGAIPAVIAIGQPDDDLREGMTRTLTRAGYVALPAADLNEISALSAAAESAIDLLLLDARLVRTATRPAVDAVRRLSSGAVTLYVASDAHDPALEPLLVAPFTPVELLAEVRRALSRAPTRRTPWVA